MIDDRPELREISLANGMFWEVIYDCVALRRRIIFTHWDHFEATLPREAKLLRDCLDELAKE